MRGKERPDQEYRTVIDVNNILHDWAPLRLDGLEMDEGDWNALEESTSDAEMSEGDKMTGEQDDIVDDDLDTVPRPHRHNDEPAAPLPTTSSNPPVLYSSRMDDSPSMQLGTDPVELALPTPTSLSWAATTYFLRVAW